jgi:cytochrome b6-f complex iron-sulfur subunit
MKRRSFIGKLAASLAAFAGVLFGISYLRQFSPKSIGKSKRVKIGSLSDFPVDTYTYIEDLNIFVYRDHEAIKSVSAVCTHLGCTIQRTTNGFECPCHGSCYSDTGKVVSGPAPTALSWYHMERVSGGDIVVDMDATVEAEEKLLIS